MMKIDPNIVVDPLQLKQLALERRPITSRFKIPATQAQAEAMLLGTVMAEVEGRRMQFANSPDLERQIRQMAEWATTDDYRCFCLLSGKYGNGKSTLVRALQQLLNLLAIKDEPGAEPWRFRIIDAREIAWLCRERNDQWRALHSERMLAIDDLGTEPFEVMDYGNRQNPVEELLHRRYDRQLTTVITTNLTPSKIAEVYGERVVDRLREAAFRIVFENESYRKPR